MADRRWLVSRAFDLGWFVVPGALALLAALIVGLTREPAEDDSLALWIVGVLLVILLGYSAFRIFRDRQPEVYQAQYLEE